MSVRKIKQILKAKQISTEIEKYKNEIAVTRDGLRELEDEMTVLCETWDGATEGLTEAHRLLSEAVEDISQHV